MGRLASQDAGLTSMDTEDLCHCTGTGLWVLIWNELWGTDDDDA